MEEATPAFNARLTPKAAQDVDSVQSWLRSAFPGLPFPNDVALQLVTHESWDHGVSAGHSRRLGFMGESHWWHGVWAKTLNLQGMPS